MIYSVKCVTCKKKGNRGVFSPNIQPDGWFAIGWTSDHSDHLETVCSITCLHKFVPDADDMPREPA